LLKTSPPPRAVYGWADYTPKTSDEEILRRLLALNLERSGTSA
jgi:hypothetical protein